MKTQKYIVTIKMPDGNRISSEWLKDLIESDCCIEEEDEGKFSISVEEISSSEDLEEEIKRYEANLPESATVDPFEGHPTLEDVARHFANWQKEHMGEQARKELAKTDITLADLVAFDEGLKLGRKLERQDMLKDAVEGRTEEVTFNNGEKHNTVYYSIHEGALHSESRIWIPYMGLKDGDKVKIIIIPNKEDKE